MKKRPLLFAKMTARFDQNDRSFSEKGAVVFHKSGGRFSVKDIVVGIVDMGFKYGHPNFYNYDQTDLRIKRVWNQGDETGMPPQGYEYGTELREKIICAKYDTDEHSHGTHVTGIAAGTDTVDNPFYGIAVDADIVLVSFYDREENPYANASLNIVTKLFDELDASLQAGNEKTYSLEGIEGFISVITEISPLNGNPHVSIPPLS